MARCPSTWRESSTLARTIVAAIIASGGILLSGFIASLLPVRFVAKAVIERKFPTGSRPRGVSPRDDVLRPEVLDAAFAGYETGSAEIDQPEAPAELRARLSVQCESMDAARDRLTVGYGSTLARMARSVCERVAGEYIRREHEDVGLRRLRERLLRAEEEHERATRTRDAQERRLAALVSERKNAASPSSRSTSIPVAPSGPSPTIVTAGPGFTATAELRRERDRLASLYTDRHPVVMALDARLRQSLPAEPGVALAATPSATIPKQSNGEFALVDHHDRLWRREREEQSKRVAESHRRAEAAARELEEARLALSESESCRPICKLLDRRDESLSVEGRCRRRLVFGVGVVASVAAASMIARPKSSRPLRQA